MAHKLYFTDSDTPIATYRANKWSLSPYHYADLDDALRRAREIAAVGGVPWEIECDDGRTIGRSEIARLLRDRAADLSDPPRVH
jgi:hypothetical protein